MIDRILTRLFGPRKPYCYRTDFKNWARPFEVAWCEMVCAIKGHRVFKDVPNDCERCGERL
jgi:hypothetical protein